MQQLFAIITLTWKAALRFRLFVVIAVLLLLSVVGLPLLIRDDGTARGFTQILLTYTLGTITALLGLSTLWLSCGILARDIEESQMQVVVVKPIPRWRIWLGKWLGIMTLNAALLGISGLSVYVLLQWRATRLPAAEQKILREEVLVARGSVRPPNFEKKIAEEADRILQDRIKKNPSIKANLVEVRKQIYEGVKAQFQILPPEYSMKYDVDLGPEKSSIRGQPLRLRIKFNAADQSVSGTYQILWRVGMPKKTELEHGEMMSVAPDTFHEVEIKPYFDDKGILTITLANPNNTALLIPLTDGVEVLYRQGGFAANFVRGLCIILCWMGLLSALGLASASFLSFPVAAFLSLAVLTMALCSGTLSNATAEGTLIGFNEETSTTGHTPVDFLVIPLFRGILAIVNLAKDFSPIDSLSTGRSITWTQLGLAFAQIILLLGGCLALFGMYVFSRRELATAQGNQ
jgi:hypothetical protein